MATSRKLSGAIEGALAAGGDPATSPLYVFGPFLRLIVPAGVASVTFGASILMVPVLYTAMTVVRRVRAAPTSDEDYLGRCIACTCPSVEPRECSCGVALEINSI